MEQFYTQWSFLRETYGLKLKFEWCIKPREKNCEQCWTLLTTLRCFFKGLKKHY